MAEGGKAWGVLLIGSLCAAFMFTAFGLALQEHPSIGSWAFLAAFSVAGFFGGLFGLGLGYLIADALMQIRRMRHYEVTHREEVAIGPDGGVEGMRR